MSQDALAAIAALPEIASLTSSDRARVLQAVSDALSRHHDTGLPIDVQIDLHA